MPVHCQSSDVQRAADFYTRHLGFKLKHQQLPMFAVLHPRPQVVPVLRWPFNGVTAWR